MAVRKTFFWLFFLLLACVWPERVFAAESYSQISTIKASNIPASVNLMTCPSGWNFDFSWVDADRRRYYLADRCNKSIDVVNTADDTLVGSIGGFVGDQSSDATSGPNGIVVLNDPHQLWVADGDSTVKVFALDDSGNDGTLIASISTAGLNRANKLAYDSNDQLILVANDADAPPFVSFISVTDLQVVAILPLPEAVNGIEQSVYNEKSNKFLLAIPETTENLGGEIAVIAADAMKLTTVYPLESCEPHGLALGPDQNLLVGCSADVSPGEPLKSLILDAGDGHLVQTVTEVGGSEEVWYNPGDKRYYLAASHWTNTGRAFTGSDDTVTKTTPVLGVIDAESNAFIQNVSTGPSSGSVAADPASNRIYVPLQASGICVYASVP